MSIKPVTTSHKLLTTRSLRTPSDFGKNLRRAREERRPRTRLAEETKRADVRNTGVCENTIYNIENGRTQPSLEAQRLLTQVITAALGCEYPWEATDKPLNKTSLTEFIKNSEIAGRIDHAIAAAKKLRTMPPEAVAQIILERAEYLGLKTPPQIETLLVGNEKLVTTFGIICYQKKVARMPIVPRGFCIAALQVILVLRENDPKKLLDFITKHGLDPEESPRLRAKVIKSAYDEAMRTLKGK